jgi:hypothetical protein
MALHLVMPEKCLIFKSTVPYEKLKTVPFFLNGALRMVDGPKGKSQA